jgi:outer membrane murein-binding lipoprotein Lpp
MEYIEEFVSVWNELYPDDKVTDILNQLMVKVDRLAGDVQRLEEELEMALSAAAAHADAHREARHELEAWQKHFDSERGLN